MIKNVFRKAFVFSLALLLVPFVNAHNCSIFSSRLYAQVDEERENMVVSPYSIYVALAMAYSGADGHTKKEMENVLGVSTPESLYQNLKETQESLSNQGCELHIANKIFAQQDFVLLDSFTGTLQKYFNSLVEQVDFSDSEQSSITINDWVSQETRERIQSLVSSSDLDETTRLVLANSIYFKGEWEKKFDPNDTAPDFFYASNDAQIEIEMMEQEKDFDYMENDEVQVVELPYKDSSLAMRVILPKDNHMLEGVLDWDVPLTKKRVLVRIPKFKIESSCQLKEVLSEMGMPSAFTDSADFSGITGKPSIYISKVLHKAFIEVGEKGTEAAAATAIIMNLKSYSYTESPPAVIFNADRPFAFMILDTDSGAILFTGKVTNPVA